MKIKITRDFRCFKSGAEYNIDPQPGEITFMVGENGCGKSTLMFAMRTHLDSLKERDKKRTDGMREIALLTHILDVKGSAVIEDFGFDKAFYRDTVADNPNSFINAATAFSYVSGGGLGAEHRNNGRNRVDMICRLISDAVQMCGDYCEDRMLFVMDELDDGLDMRAQIRLSFIINHLVFDHFPNASVIVITHSILTALGADYHPEIKHRVFDVQHNEYTTAREYFEKVTNYEIELSKKPKEE